ncbi:hypothetical protein Tsubulata_040810 [Turnera subulata]|uniref:RPA-interacting protein C-terminal domain-containing protein n=1 Tax=Turnera subulata TaxID=218843 RepID=A0A9Q0GHU1_9ROSI|nr:hypothetical protein Tsubulata_040810 [Turnera subulata]
MSLRENCYKRVRQDRTHLLWKMRLLPPLNSSNTNNKDFMKTAFRDIVSDELNKIKLSSLNDGPKVSDPAAEANDLLWEYDGLHDAYQGDCEEILLEMQRIFYEDLRAQPDAKEPENYIETWEDEEDEYLASAVYEHMQLTDEKLCKKTWCPICKQGELQENHQFIRCSLCELQLRKDNETRLAEAHSEHLDRGCRLKPQFCVETRFGFTALYILCKGCNIFEMTICINKLCARPWPLG